MALQNPRPNPARDLAPLVDLYAGEWHIEPPRRIFVNRNLKMSTIRLIGFDMDYTLAVYDKLHLEKLAFDATRDKLIAELHYPDSIAALQYDPELVIRGLVVDKRLGNVLKIDQYNYVSRAYHGSRLIPSEVRKHLYRNSRIRLSSDKYMSIDTLFGLPEAALFCLLVDHFELVEKTPWRDWSRLYDDVRTCIDRAHADDTIKREIVKDPAGFIVKDPQLPPTLAALRAQGKKLFLLTNSEPYYTEIVMRYLLGGALESMRDWREYFDHVVVSAGKPGFYQNERPLVAMTGDEMEQAGMQRGGPVYTGGCSRMLEELSGHRGDEVLYVGDHTFGDILRAKKRPGWRTAMIIEELKHEIELERSLAGEYQVIDELVSRRNGTILEGNRLRRRLHQLVHRRDGDAALPPEDRARLDEQIQQAEARIRSLEDEVTSLGVSVKERKVLVERRFNRHWGKLFKCGEINSRFGHQVKDFACIYTSAVSNFLAYPDSMYFRSTREIMPHEMGIEMP
jgi:HAD superfamily 5'-nucleotidase-like hydrolase